ILAGAAEVAHRPQGATPPGGLTPKVDSQAETETTSLPCLPAQTPSVSFFHEATGDAALIDYAQPIVNELRANMVRVDADFSATPFKAKIADAEQLRVHTMLIIGGKDMEAGNVSVRLHHGGPQGAKPKAEVVAKILADIKERRA
ncbi:MAG TPA: His/Gly/Thr/Pro-type tRNA ligase C-terminal domain-containing protein, partial [Verrucomicrobiota bacterium]|nr:His/Gly/Thr/Pro-type tRNA ligase C-terminal domain-containing protein [Verrucomicrobiota bacterium]